METDLHELATNARLNHWPPHLGVTTEAEKVEYLAQQLEEAALIVEDHELNCCADEMFELSDTLALIEAVVKNPELVVETPEDILLRKRAEQLYHNSGGQSFSGVSDYEAGWKAARAHYEGKQ